MKQLVILYELNRASGFGHRARMNIFFKACVNHRSFSKVFLEERAYVNRAEGLVCDVLVCDFASYSNLSQVEIDFIKSVPVSVAIEAYDNVSLFTKNHFIFDYNADDEQNRENIKNALVDNKFNLNLKGIQLDLDFGIISLGGTANTVMYNSVISEIRRVDTKFPLFILSPSSLGVKEIAGVPVLVNDKRYIDYLHSCSFGVVAPGMSMLEMLVLKKDTYLVSLNEGHHRFIEFLERENIAFPLRYFREPKRKNLPSLANGANRLIKKLE